MTLSIDHLQPTASLIAGVLILIMRKRTSVANKFPGASAAGVECVHWSVSRVLESRNDHDQSCEPNERP